VSTDYYTRLERGNATGVSESVIDSMHRTPALVTNGRLDVLYANALAQALFARVYADPRRPSNNARFVFLDSASTAMYRDWSAVADDTVALLQAEAGRDPHDRQMSDLVGELSIRSDEFRTRWAAHDVRIHTSGVKLMHHPVVGDLDLPYESFPLPGDPGQSLVTYTAEPGSPTEDALNLLASWSASGDQPNEPTRSDQDT
jgi:hypothetical protein